MPAAMPVSSDVTNLLADAGVTAPSNATVAAALAAAIATWNSMTGYEPFLAASATRYFDPPGGSPRGFASPKGGSNVLRFDCGLVSLTSLSVAGVSKTQGTDFWLKPANKAASGKPYEWAEFSAPLYGKPNDVVVVGSWGYSATVPDDAWNAVLELAAAIAVAGPNVKASGGVLSYTIGSQVSETFAQSPFKAAIDQWLSDASLCAKGYARAVSYL